MRKWSLSLSNVARLAVAVAVSICVLGPISQTASANGGDASDPDNPPASVNTDTDQNITPLSPQQVSSIASELTRLNSSQISQYHMMDLSQGDMEMLLDSLKPNDLYKVLINVQSDDLQEIQDRLTPMSFDQALSRLPDENKTHIENRLSGNETFS
jgi:hypothetical protein